MTDAPPTMTRAQRAALRRALRAECANRGTTSMDPRTGRKVGDLLVADLWALAGDMGLDRPAILAAWENPGVATLAAHEEAEEAAAERREASTSAPASIPVSSGTGQDPEAEPQPVEEDPDATVEEERQEGHAPDTRRHRGGRARRAGADGTWRLRRHADPP